MEKRGNRKKEEEVRNRASFLIDFIVIHFVSTRLILGTILKRAEAVS